MKINGTSDSPETSRQVQRFEELKKGAKSCPELLAWCKRRLKLPVSKEEQ